jgi:hypothetical protein
MVEKNKILSVNAYRLINLNYLTLNLDLASLELNDEGLI